MSRLMRSVLCYRNGQKGLALYIKNAKLAYGYRAWGKLNRQLAEESVSSDNEALASAEQKLTECETK